MVRFMISLPRMLVMAGILVTTFAHYAPSCRGETVRLSALAMVSP